MPVLLQEVPLGMGWKSKTHLLLCLLDSCTGPSAPSEPLIQQNGSLVKSGIHGVHSLGRIRHFEVCRDQDEEPDSREMECIS